MNIGVVLHSLDVNQLAYETIFSINKEIEGGSSYDYRIFFENLSTRCLPIKCGIMNISEVWHYNGVLITTTLLNTALTSRVMGNIKRVFWVWDLEWLRGANNYLSNLQVYRNPNILLIARSLEHAQAIEHYANRRVNGIMPEISLKELTDKLCQN